jgi:hypothetical protein
MDIIVELIIQLEIYEGELYARLHSLIPSNARGLKVYPILHLDLLTKPPYSISIAVNCTDYHPFHESVGRSNIFSMSDAEPYFFLQSVYNMIECTVAY